MCEVCGHVSTEGWGFCCPVSSGISAWVPVCAHLRGRVPMLHGPPALPMSICGRHRVPCVRPSICPLRGSLCDHAAAEWTAKRGRDIVTAEGP